ncbi:TPA: hypothetical protein ACH3X3_012610 [Trebouxia sp. C0006]
MSSSTRCPQICDLPQEVLSQILTFCTADLWSIRQVNRRLKLAAAMEVRVIRIRPQSGLRAEAVKPSKQKPPQALQRQYPVLRQVWLSAIPMDSTPVVDATPSVLRSVEHCKSLVIAGDSAALTYAEANLPSFFPGNCKLALDHDFYPSQRKSKSLLCKLGNSLINMPRGLQHAMKALLIHPPQSVLFLNLQVLHKIWLDQTLSTVLKHCPQIRELHHVSTQPEQCCAWADLQCCHTLQQLDQVSQVQHEINRHVRAYGKAADPACFKQVMRPMVDYLYNSMPNLQQVFNMQRSAGQERLLACRLIDSTGCARVHIQGQWDLQ